MVVPSVTRSHGCVGCWWLGTSTLVSTSALASLFVVWRATWGTSLGSSNFKGGLRLPVGLFHHHLHLRSLSRDWWGLEWSYLVHLPKLQHRSLHPAATGGSDSQQAAQPLPLQLGIKAKSPRVPVKVEAEEEAANKLPWAEAEIAEEDCREKKRKRKEADKRPKESESATSRKKPEQEKKRRRSRSSHRHQGLKEKGVRKASHLLRKSGRPARDGCLKSDKKSLHQAGWLPGSLLNLHLGGDSSQSEAEAGEEKFHGPTIIGGLAGKTRASLKEPNKKGSTEGGERREGASQAACKTCCGGG